MIIQILIRLIIGSSQKHRFEAVSSIIRSSLNGSLTKQITFQTPR